MFISEPISEAKGIKSTDWLSLQHTLLYLGHIGVGRVISQSRGGALASEEGSDARLLKQHMPANGIHALDSMFKKVSLSTLWRWMIH